MIKNILFASLSVLISSMISVVAFADIPMIVTCDTTDACAKFGPTCAIVKFAASVSDLGSGNVQGFITSFTMDGKNVEDIDPHELVNGTLTERQNRTTLVLNSYRGRQRAKIEMDMLFIKDMESTLDAQSYGPVSAMIAGPVSYQSYMATCTVRME